MPMFSDRPRLTGLTDKSVYQPAGYFSLWEFACVWPVAVFDIVSVLESDQLAYQPATRYPSKMPNTLACLTSHTPLMLLIGLGIVTASAMHYNWLGEKLLMKVVYGLDWKLLWTHRSLSLSIGLWSLDQLSAIPSGHTCHCSYISVYLSQSPLGGFHKFMLLQVQVPI